MSGADSKVLASVISFLDGQKLDSESVDVQSGIQLRIQSGTQKTTVNVYNTGAIVVGGPDSPLKTLLLETKKAIDEDWVRSGPSVRDR